MHALFWANAGTLQPRGPGWQLERVSNGAPRGMVIEGRQLPEQNPAYRPSAQILAAKHLYSLVFRLLGRACGRLQQSENTSVKNRNIALTRAAEMGISASHKDFAWKGLFPTHAGETTMAKPATIKIRLNSTAGTGHFYVTKKNARTLTEKMVVRKYDPVKREHVEYKEGKIK